MSRRSTKLLKAALSALHYTGADGLIAPFTSGKGVIFMLHHVTPEAAPDGGFSPNGILKVTPAFLESVIVQVKAAGFDCISLDDVPKRLADTSETRPFAVFTLDDGYKDNRDHAYPIFKRHGVPFTIYVPTAFADGSGDLWWLKLEEALRELPRVRLDMNGTGRSFELSTDEERTAAFHEIYWWLRRIPEDQARGVVNRIARDAGLDGAKVCQDLVMSWDELRALAADPLVTIGAHTTHHYALAELSDDKVRSEIADNVARITAEIGRPCRHLSYPYGCELSAGEREFQIARDLGMQTAVTTRKGLLHGYHADLTTALPRLSLNGDFQNPRYVKVLLSGAPFAFWNALQRWTQPAQTGGQTAPG